MRRGRLGRGGGAGRGQAARSGLGALFLDRDGVINQKPPDGEYVTEPAGFRFIPGVPEAIADFRAMAPRVPIFVVTNQRGIALDRMSRSDVDAIHAHMRGGLRVAGGDVHGVYVCGHGRAACDCRKPGVGLFRRALADRPDIDLASSLVVGDSLADIEAGHRLGARVCLVGEPARRSAVRRQAAQRGITIHAEAASLAELVARGPIVEWLTPRRERRVVVVGSGMRFLSGISVYSVRLASALATAGMRTSLLTMRQLLPTRLYPGRERVGADLTDLRPDPEVRVHDGVDWHWMPSLFRGFAFVAARRPDALVLQWWTGTVLHTYLALCILARLLGARVVVEFHEVLDTGEVRIPLWRTYASLMGAAVVRLADGFVVHSTFDRDQLRSAHRLGARPVAVIHHGPYEHYRATEGPPGPRPVLRDAPRDVCNLLFFGVIRPYKGLEDLIDAFERIPEAEIDGYWLTVVGETWEGWTLPGDRIAASPRRDRITFVNRYVTDQELDGYLNGADAVVLPYHRSSISGPLHVATTYGLPIVMTAVGGNAEAAAAYEGLRLVPPRDPDAILARLRSLRGEGGRRYRDPNSWSAVAKAYQRFLDQVVDGTPPGRSDQPAPVRVPDRDTERAA